MSKKNKDRKGDSLLHMFLESSNALDNNIEKAEAILREDGLDPKEIRKDGLAFINQLQEKTKQTEIASQIDLDSILTRLVDAGVPKPLLEKKLFPIALQSAKKIGHTAKANVLVSFISTIFSLELADILGRQPIRISSMAASTAKFKIPTNANLNQIRAYSHYAYYLSKLVAKTYSPTRLEASPADIDEFRNNYLDKYKTFHLHGLITYAWEIGICVLPLNDPGVFHGAAWSIDGVRVVVIKQHNKSHARWIFDLLHEVYHALAHIDDARTSLLETHELNPFADNNSEEEKEANTFSHQVLFADRTQEILNLCVEKTGGRMSRLKNVVQNIALVENIRPDILANFVAFRLSLDNQDWWAAAASLQITEPDPFSIAVEILRNNIELKGINQMEHDLLNLALQTN